jgi:hypothetical protein
MARDRNQRPANIAYYASNRERELGRIRDRQAATLALLRRLRDVPCMDCGGRFAAHQMDFDHRDPIEKSFRITAGGAMLRPRHRLLEEVAKCDVVCANCHRIRSRNAHRERLAADVRTAASPGLERRRDRWRAHARLLDSLRNVPCRDCGAMFPSCSMDFDHRDPQTKTAGVTRLVGRAGISRLLAEAAKCDIVCANCHRSRTFRRRSVTAPERE